MAESALRYANDHRKAHCEFGVPRPEWAEKGDATGRRAGNDVMVCLDISLLRLAVNAER